MNTLANLITLLSKQTAVITFTSLLVI